MSPEKPLTGYGSGCSRTPSVAAVKSYKSRATAVSSETNIPANIRVPGKLVTIGGVGALEPEEYLALRARNEEFWGPVNPPSQDSRDDLSKIMKKLQNRWQERRGYTFGVTENESTALVGLVGLETLNWNRFHLSAEIGYATDQNKLGRGFATEAVHLLCRVAFERLGLHRLVAGIQPHNDASVRVIEKAGFRFEGIARDWLYLSHGWADHRIYTLTEPDWRVLKAAE
jgi:[ribosomal protein S5]-alanine N-acetyltransferase